MWPPDTSNFDKLYTLLNPPSHLGNAEGTADERSLIYCTGDTSAAAIVFINFDLDIELSSSTYLNHREKAKGKDKLLPLGIGFNRSVSHPVAGNADWILTEEALYKTIGQGFRLQER